MNRDALAGGGFFNACLTVNRRVSVAVMATSTWDHIQMEQAEYRYSYRLLVSIVLDCPGAMEMNWMMILFSGRTSFRQDILIGRK